MSTNRVSKFEDYRTGCGCSGTLVFFADGTIEAYEGFTNEVHTCPLGADECAKCPFNVYHVHAVNHVNGWEEVEDRISAFELVS